MYFIYLHLKQKLNGEKKKKDPGNHCIIIQSILITHRFCTYKLAHLLKFICDPQTNTPSISAVICRHAQSKEQWVAGRAWSQPVFNKKTTIYLLVSAHAIKKVSFLQAM